MTSSQKSHRRAAYGCGVGLRSEHYGIILEKNPPMDWFEAVSENFMDTGGRPFHILKKIRAHYPVALHGVALSIGSADPLNSSYLQRLKNLIERIDPFIVSDHLCWTGIEGKQIHDLLPLPYTGEAVRHVVERVLYVQDFLKRRILLENVSSYVTYRHSELTEWEFLAEVSKRSGCGILLDLNNIYVNSKNHGFDPESYLRRLSASSVEQFHLAGHTDMGEYLFDTHGGEVIDPVWELYQKALGVWGQVPTLIEWDEKIPSFERLAEEAARARRFYERAPLEGLRTMEYDAAEPEFPAAEIEKENRSLKETQAWFKKKILPYEEPAGMVEDILNPQGSVSGAERLSVYSGGYIARIGEALKEAYEAVRHVLGEDAFHQLCLRYASGFPSENYNLSMAGRYLPQFLSQDALSKKLPFLPDLAMLEWKIIEAFHSFDKQPLLRDALGRLSLEDWERAVFEFQPSAQLMPSSWPVLDIWQARKAPVESIKIQLEGCPQKVLVFRSGLETRCVLLGEDQYRFLKVLSAGKTLGEACEDIQEISEHPPLQEWFAVWIQYGIFSGITVLHAGADNAGIEE